jgi:Trk-type K+ transport system membrane component
MEAIIITIFIIFSIFGLGAGFLCAINPEQAIEIQRRFYEKINWNIEPISVSKEIRNTRAMGLFLIILVVIALFLVLTNNLILL